VQQGWDEVVSKMQVKIQKNRAPLPQLFFRLLSMLRAQLAHVIPVTGRVTFFIGHRSILYIIALSKLRLKPTRLEENNNQLR